MQFMDEHNLRKMNDDVSDNLKMVMVFFIEKVEFNKNSYPYYSIRYQNKKSIILILHISSGESNYLIFLSDLASFRIFRIYAIEL